MSNCQLSPVSKIAHEWPSGVPLDARRAYADFCCGSPAESVLLGLAIEEYLDLCTETLVDLESFVSRFPEIRSALFSRLKRLESSSVGAASSCILWPRTGEIIGTFHLQELMGVGGFARVYRALDISMGSREVAIKLTSQTTREPAILGNLSHPRVALAYSQTNIDYHGVEFACICMPYCGSHTAADVEAIGETLRKKGTVPTPFGPLSCDLYIELVQDIIHHASEGLDYIHRAGILHLDVKPSNVVVTKYGSARLIDFAGAQPIGCADASTVTITPRFAAPEVLELLTPSSGPSLPLTPATDVFSLGISAKALLSPSVLNGRRGGWKRLGGEAIQFTLDRACLPNREDRFQSAIEFSDALKKAMSGRIGRSNNRRIASLTAGTAALLAISSLAIRPLSSTGNRDHVAKGSLPEVDQTAEKKRDNPAAHWNDLGVASMRERRNLDAIVFFKKALHDNPHFVPAHFNLVLAETILVRLNDRYQPTLDSADFLCRNTDDIGFGVPLDCGFLYLLASEQLKEPAASALVGKACDCFLRAKNEGASAEDLSTRLQDVPPNSQLDMMQALMPFGRSGDLLKFSLVSEPGT